MSLIQKIIDGEITLKQAKEIEDSMPTATPMPSTYKIVRTYSAEVFAGYIESRNGQEVVMRDARRLWQWAGASSLPELAQSGTSAPEKCKFTEKVDRIELLQVIEILNVTDEAKNSIENVKVWKA